MCSNLPVPWSTVAVRYMYRLQRNSAAVCTDYGTKPDRRLHAFVSLCVTRSLFGEPFCISGMESSLPSPAQDEGTGRRTARALLTGDFGLSLCASRGTRRTRRLRRLQRLGLGPRWRTTVQHSYANEMRRIRHTPRSVSSMQRWGFEAKCSVSSCIDWRATSTKGVEQRRRCEWESLDVT